MYKKIQKKEKEHHVREIFLYDILKRWTEIQIQETMVRWQVDKNEKNETDGNCGRMYQKRNGR
uniref:Uncharacterized protein n=1 Tax=Rhizophagus irregularis (strain DAOM 181602 / DAOM 197198 / MUCL 43194) TaxID=747089 RepID=U9T352_RHIID